MERDLILNSIFLEQMEIDLGEEITEFEKLFLKAGEVFNLSSLKQLGVLFLKN